MRHLVRDVLNLNASTANKAGSASIRHLVRDVLPTTKHILTQVHN